MKTALSVNVNKVALLRNSRANGLPSVLHACNMALRAGAQGITIHRLTSAISAAAMWMTLPR